MIMVKKKYERPEIWPMHYIEESHLLVGTREIEDFSKPDPWPDEEEAKQAYPQRIGGTFDDYQDQFDDIKERLWDD